MEKYLDTSLSFKERAEDLVSRMTVEEMASQLKYDAPAIKRLGIPAYNWWSEALHGVARAGTATVFPQAIGLAAMFDDKEMYAIADIISTEARAKYNAMSGRGDRDIYKGLTFWSPNVNIFRDPRWGRGQETYGEDPYLTAELGKAFVNGLQQSDENGYLKVAACAKHYAVHSGPEALRHEFDALASDKDMWETYLPAFEELVVEANVEAVMGAYNRTNGEPCCGSKTLLIEILREKWGFRGHVVSDCWAIRDFHTHHRVTKTAPESAALALKSGCDLNCGNTYLHLLAALEEERITAEDLKAAAVRLLTTRLKLGLFEKTQYDSLPYSVVDCDVHNQKAYEAALKSIVLLKNNGILPLNRGTIKSVAVIGPNSTSEDVLKGNYCGTPSRNITLLDGIRQAVGSDIRVHYAQGCHLFKDRVENLALPDDRLQEAFVAAQNSDVVILCLGLDATLEGEQGDTGNAMASGDKLDLNLPASQMALLECVASAGKPMVLLLSTGSAMGIGRADELCAAIMQTWYPGQQGGRAVADLLFGNASPSGKLPITFYHSVEELPDFEDYSMQNRTYRYFGGKPLYPFGFGLSYGNIVVEEVGAEAYNGPEYGIKLVLTAINHSTIPCEDVVQVYIRALGSPDAPPNPLLAAFKRISLGAGEDTRFSMHIDPKRLITVNQQGERLPWYGNFEIFAGTSQPDETSAMLTGKAPVKITVLAKE